MSVEYPSQNKTLRNNLERFYVIGEMRDDIFGKEDSEAVSIVFESMRKGSYFTYEDYVNVN